MCFAPDSTMTITTGEPVKAPLSDTNAVLNEVLTKDISQRGKPAGSIDLTDETLAAARKSTMLRLLQGQGRSSTFLTGPAGVTSPLPLGMAKLYGA